MQCEMAVIDSTGDTKVVWDSDNEVEVEVARSTFDKLRAKGYLAFAVRANGDKGEVITEFDPTAEKLIMAPALRGG